jgi:hypothetical protein
MWIASGITTAADWRELLLASSHVRQTAGRLETVNDDTGLFHATGLRNNPDGLVERYEDETGSV